jgi:hypothetical protein
MQDTKEGRIKVLDAMPKTGADATVTEPEVATQGYTKIWGHLPLRAVNQRI